MSLCCGRPTRGFSAPSRVNFKSPPFGRWKVLLILPVEGGRYQYLHHNTFSRLVFEVQGGYIFLLGKDDGILCIFPMFFLSWSSFSWGVQATPWCFWCICKIHGLPDGLVEQKPELGGTKLASHTWEVFFVFRNVQMCLDARLESATSC